jgi:hypothetical protein
MSNLSRIHEDYLDPDKHLYHEYDDSDQEITMEQQGRIDSIRQRLENAKAKAYDPKNRKIPTLKSLFEHCPEGDFHWDGEPEDVGNAWNCGDSDCEAQWHESCQCIEMGRQDGKTYFIVLMDSNAGDGDYQPEAGWDEREGDIVDESTLRDLWFHLEGRTIDHWYSWGIYDLDCVMTGKDPLNKAWSPKILSIDDHIKSAERNLEHLLKH